jgi:hypothetical protein
MEPVPRRKWWRRLLRLPLSDAERLAFAEWLVRNQVKIPPLNLPRIQIPPLPIIDPSVLRAALFACGLLQSKRDGE